MDKRGAHARAFEGRTTPDKRMTFGNRTAPGSRTNAQGGGAPDRRRSAPTNAPAGGSAHAPRSAHAAQSACGSRTDIGCIRENNEDNLLVAPPLYVVADGMGGHAAGEVASEIAIQVLATSPLTDSRPEALRAAVIEANRAVLDGACRGIGKPGMGTTITAALLKDDRLIIAQVGDSRAYLLHGGYLRQTTRDHSLMAELIALGEITPEQARTHPQRSVITRVLGSEPGTQPDLYELNVATGDRLLLCSDGLTTMLEDEEIAELLRGCDDPQHAADTLVQVARDKGGYDNITVIIVDIDATTPREQRRQSHRVRRSVFAFLLAFVLLIAGVVGGFVALAYNSYFVVSEGGIVQAYRGFPGEFLGMRLRWELERPANSLTLAASAVRNPTVASELAADGIRLDSPEQVEEWFTEQSALGTMSTGGTKGTGGTPPTQGMGDTPPAQGTGDTTPAQGTTQPTQPTQTPAPTPTQNGGSSS